MLEWGSPCPSPGDLPGPGTGPGSLSLAGELFTPKSPRNQEELETGGVDDKETDEQVHQ